MPIERDQAQGYDGNITATALEKGHFTPKMTKGVIFIFLKYIYKLRDAI